jgi:homoserine O-acetyltransferase
METTIRVFADRPLRLTAGDTLSPVDVRLEWWGPEDPDRVILVCHALTGDAHAARHTPDDRPGWWDAMIGPGRPLDTRSWWVICMNVLGGVAGTTGPASPGPDGQPWQDRFPAVSVADMVRVQHAALRELGIRRLKLVTGGSLGGMQALEWAWRYPGMVEAVAAVGAADRLSALGLGLNAAQREAVLLGLEAGRPGHGLRAARMLAMLSYRSAEHFERRFGRKPADASATGPRLHFSVESYLQYQGEKLARRFDAWAYLRLIRAMDLFDLWDAGDGPPRHAVPARVYLAGISSDWLFPPAQVLGLARRLQDLGMAASYTELASELGHDAFLTDLAAQRAWLSAVLQDIQAWHRSPARRPPVRAPLPEAASEPRGRSLAPPG